MIKISLTDNYVEDEIEEIFNQFSRDINDVFQITNIKLKYNEVEVTVSEKEIFKFLTATDYFNYNIDYGTHEDISIDDLKQTLGLKGKAHFKTLEKKIRGDKQLLEKYGHILMQYYISYDRLSDENRHKVISKMNVIICPYCNMNYILNYDKNANRNTTADLDHFYVKITYPDYALCLYNFIPSCQVCNSRLKGKKNMEFDTHIHPHFNSFGKYNDFRVDNILEILLEDKEIECEISLNKNTTQVKNSDKMFKIEERYKELHSIAYKWLEKAIIYNDSYQEELKDILKGVDTKSLVFGKKLMEEEMLNESLGKFKMDLLKQFGIYK